MLFRFPMIHVPRRYMFSIFFSGQITWMAKAELAITQFFCAGVARLVQDIVKDAGCFGDCLTAIQFRFRCAGET